MTRDDKNPLTQRPFGELIHSAFIPPEQVPIKNGDNRGEGRNRPRDTNRTKKEANQMTHGQTHGTQAEQMGRHAEENRTPRSHAHQDREPETGPVGVGIERLLGVVVHTMEQNSAILGEVVKLHQSQTLQQTSLLTEINISLKEQATNAGKQAKFIELLEDEVKKSRKGKKKSLFGKTTWEKAEDAAWGAGRIALGVSVGYGVFKLAEAGIKAMSGPMPPIPVTVT